MRMARIMKTPVPRAEGNVLQMPLSCIADRRVKWCNHFQNNLAASYKFKQTLIRAFYQ